MAFLAQKVWVLVWKRVLGCPTTAFSRWDCQGSLDWGVWFVYLSGVNFQALSSFWACSSLSLVCSSSPFIFRKNKLMAGSTIVDLSWATLGCWTCLRYWIWVCAKQKKQLPNQKKSLKQRNSLLLTWQWISLLVRCVTPLISKVSLRLRV